MPHHTLHRKIAVSHISVFEHSGLLECDSVLLGDNITMFCRLHCRQIMGNCLLNDTMWQCIVGWQRNNVLQITLPSDHGELLAVWHNVTVYCWVTM